MSLEARIIKKFSDFTLDVCLPRQEGATAILGGSGCGKSLTLKAIAGIVRPDAGRIVLNGRVLFDSERRINLRPQERHVGLLFQSYALFPNMTVLQNIMCGAPKKLPPHDKRALASEWVHNMQLEGLENHRPSQLSGGQQQRTALARVLISRPEILMLDEPFSALDSHLREQLIPEVKQLLKTWDKDALLVTHNRDEAYELCQTLAIMDSGRFVSYGPTQAVFDDPRSRAAAVLTGCKNVVAAGKAGGNSVYVPDWGVELTAAQPVPDNLTGIGIRAHYFSPDIQQNAYPVAIIDEVEEPFAWILKFRYAAQRPDSRPIWWRLSKDRLRTSRRGTVQLGVLPQDVLLLTE